MKDSLYVIGNNSKKLVPGQEFIFGEYEVTKQEAVEFASRYDPQDFHIDETAAAAHPIFGKICASGVHTLAIAQSLQMRGFKAIGIHPVAGAGMDELRLPHPVFPGDVLKVKLRIEECRNLRSRPDRDVLTYTLEVLNQDNTAVLTNRSTLFIARGPGD